jgi:Cellulase (glycosyl hydrolase family 5)
MTRRSWYGLVAALLCLALLPMGWLLLRRPPEPTPRFPPRTEQGCDALCGRTRAELNDFASWLAGNQARGYIGEVGWPDNREGEASEWNRVGEAWYEAADAAGLPVTAWSAGEWWHDYKLAVYTGSPAGGVDRPNSQASVIERHRATETVPRGVNVSGGEFKAPSVEPVSAFSNADPGVYDRDYHYDSQATFDYLAGRGATLARIPFRWERVQPELGGPLDRDELARLRAVVGRAHRAGLQVVLDLHNFGAYYLFDGQRGVRQPLGSSQLPGDRLVDVWVRLSAAFRSHPGVLAYSIMNEPTGMPPGAGGLSPAQAWERSSQAVVEALRRHGDEKTIAVPGYDWSGVRGWSDTHPRGWIRDPGRNFVYEAHHYFDQHHSGEYPLTYAEELAAAERSGDGG